MSEYNQEECPVCYMQINEVNICVTVCKHTFHTGCIIRCNNTCPICRTNLLTNEVTSNSIGKILPGVYNSDEYLRQLEINNIDINTVSLTTKIWLDDCEEDKKDQIFIKEIKKQRDEEHKNFLKKTDPHKFRLFYGK